MKPFWLIFRRKLKTSVTNVYDDMASFDRAVKFYYVVIWL